jgi:hypothetical protein
MINTNAFFDFTDFPGGARSCHGEKIGKGSGREGVESGKRAKHFVGGGEGGRKGARETTRGTRGTRGAEGTKGTRGTTSTRGTRGAEGTIEEDDDDDDDKEGRARIGGVVH